jgi:hypothetical protein
LLEVEFDRNCAAPFLIQGAKPGQQSGLFDAGFTIGNGNGIAMFAAYSAEVRSHETRQAVGRRGAHQLVRRRLNDGPFR